ncbi:MAG: methionyl-tRNA formyltransferase [Acidimicrobiia bacterium]
MRIAFLGTPADAVPSLRALHAAGFEVPLVVTQPDRRRGRGSEAMPSPVKAAASELGLEVRTPVRAIEIADELVGSGAEVGVVVAFGQLLPQALLDVPPLGFVNVHFSLLPRWRGAAPVERAMLAGDAETGVCLMQIEAGLDTGPVFARRAVGIDPDETAGELHARLVELGTALLLETLPGLASATPEPQVGEHTYAARLTVEEFELDWARPARELALLARAGNPRPGAWTTLGGKRFKVWRARAADAGPAAGAADTPGLVGPHGTVVTGDGALVLVEVQPEGKPVMPAEAWLAGRRGETVLGT